MTGLSCRLLVGTYSQDLGFVVGQGDGLYVASVLKNTLLSGAALAALPASVLVNPTYATRVGRTVYVVDERVETEGRLCAVSVEEDGGLRALGAPLPCGSGSTCHVCVPDGGAHVLVANYGGGGASGSVASFERDQTTGALAPGSRRLVTLPPSSSGVSFPGVSAARQETSHAHMVLMTRDCTAVLVPDLGSDVVWLVPYCATEGLALEGCAVAQALPPGSGPRHVALHPALPVLYVLNELSCTLVACATDATGRPLPGAAPFAVASTLPENFALASSCAALRVDKAGRYAYCSNRVVGADGSIVRFELDALTGAPSSPVFASTHGRSPREIYILDDALLVANQDSNTILAFDLAKFPQREPGELSCPTPVCILALDD